VEAGEVHVMNCQEFWDSMPELGAADTAHGASAHPHLNDCPACTARMSRQRELAAGLRAMSASYQRVGAPASVEARLRSAFRGGTGAPAARLRPAWTLSFVWAASCAVVLALAFVVVRGGHPVVPLSTASRGAELALAAADEPQSDYEGFIPLPNAARLADTEDVNVVRVEVPRSAMIALGLEVSPERASELVAADVMLGPDGLARAVRFLDSDSL
jgi:hypothetical protein